MSNKPQMSSMFGGGVSRGLMDLPVRTPGDVGEADVVVFGAPTATPYASVGTYCADAPAAIRGAFGWPGVGDHHDFDVGGTLLAPGTSAVDWGDLVVDADDAPANRDLITSTTRSILDAGAVPLVLGGDDSVPIPVLQAYEHHGPITILQIDAHIDWRDEVSGERFGLSSNMRRASEMPWVEGIVQTGARGAGSARPQDFDDALEWGVHFFPMRDVVKGGLWPVIESIPSGSNIYVALDIDGLDPAVVPGVIGPAPGGFNYWQIIELFEGVARRGNVVGFNIAELMPSVDSEGRGALVASRLATMMLALLSRQTARVN